MLGEKTSLNTTSNKGHKFEHSNTIMTNSGHIQ